MKRMFIILLFLPASALAADKSLYPTNREVYDNCKAAIKTSEAGDQKSFLRSYCAARIDGIIEGFSTAVGGIVDLPTAEGKAASEVVKKQSQRLCQLSEPYHKDEFPELMLAKQYIEFIDHWHQDIPLEEYLNSRAATTITSAMQDDCKNKKVSMQ